MLSSFHSTPHLLPVAATDWDLSLLSNNMLFPPMMILAPPPFLLPTNANLLNCRQIKGHLLAAHSVLQDCTKCHTDPTGMCSCLHTLMGTRVLMDETGLVWSAALWKPPTCLRTVHLKAWIMVASFSLLKCILFISLVTKLLNTHKAIVWSH